MGSFSITYHLSPITRSLFRSCVGSVALFAVAFFSSSVLALEVPPPPETYVSDRAGVFSSETEAKLELGLDRFEEATSTQVVVATFPSLEGDSLEDFSIRLAEKWKVGQASKNNGVIILIFPQDRQMRIEVGYGLEGALTDALSSEIIRNVFAPEFKKGDYDKGVLEGTRAVLEAVRGEYKAEPVKTKAKEEEAGIALLILFLLAAILGIDIVRYFGYAGSHKAYAARYSALEWWLRFSLFVFILSMMLRASSRGGSSYGGSSSGHGGFSGGGGSFGGGGASGRW